MRTKPVYANCPLGALYLLLRGKGTALILVPGGNWFAPWHMAVLTPRGHCLNFYRLLPHEMNRWGAWWFLGSFRGLSRSKWQGVLGKRGSMRRLSPMAGAALILLLWLAWIVPWSVTMLVYTPLWSMYWFVRAVCRRALPVNFTKTLHQNQF